MGFDNENLSRLSVIQENRLYVNQYVLLLVFQLGVQEDFRMRFQILAFLYINYCFRFVCFSFFLYKRQDVIELKLQGFYQI